MKNNDDIPTTDTNEIKQLISRVKQGELDQGDAQLIEKLLNFLLTIVNSKSMVMFRQTGLIKDQPQVRPICCMGAGFAH